MKRKLLLLIGLLSPGYLLFRLLTRGQITLADVMIVVTVVVVAIALLARRGIT